jgi:hypothetical protein
MWRPSEKGGKIQLNKMENLLLLFQTSILK